MRRVIAGLVSTGLIGAVSLVVLGGGTASLASPPSLAPAIRPAEGQEAVTSQSPGNVVHFGGTVTPGATKVSARLYFESATNTRLEKPNCVSEPRESGCLDVTSSVIFGSNGNISGSRTLPTLQGGHQGHIYLVVTASDPDHANQTTTARSNSLEIDIVGPSITETRLTGPNTVKVVFSEDVHLQSQPDAPVDWGVEIARDPTTPSKIIYGNPTAVSRDGNTITLTMANTYDQDATPEVRYAAGLGLVPERETYRDDAANNTFVGSTFFTSRDLVAPPIPTIVTTAGKAGANVAATDATPDVQLTNIRSGHWAEIYRETSNPPNGFQRPGDAFAGTAQAGGSGATVTINDLGDDGEYTLYAIARDNAMCNPRNTNSQETCPNRSDTNATATVRYTLDTFAPRPLFASVTNPNEITVGLTEAVGGTNNPTNWSIPGAIVTAVTGNGDRRVLTTSGATVVPGATLTYTPGDHADAAGNPLAGFSALLLDQLPPLVEITDPAGTLYVQDTTYTMRGTADKANQVEIYRDDDGNGNPDTATAVATATVQGDSWSASVPLNADTSNRFIARGVRTDSTPAIVGPHVPPPNNAALIQDSQNPSLNLVPLAAAYRGDLLVNIDWSASDTNFGGNPIKIEFSKDGQSFETVEPSFPDDPPYEWRTPKISTKDARIRLTATDLAGRTTVVTSEAFEIDSIAPVFIPIVVSPSEVELAFSEPVKGLFAALEWQIDDQTAGQIDPVGLQSGVNEGTLTAGPMGPTMDPKGKHSVSYESASPFSGTSEIVDHVGNRLILGTGQGTGEVKQPTVPSDEIATCTIIGTPGADILNGSNGPDVICPLGGTDSIDALGGDDIVVMGTGAKTINGGSGNDEINGSESDDILTGGDGHDVIFGFDGADQIDGGDGEDVVNGDEAGDDIEGGTGVDVIKGGSGNDRLDGGLGNDQVGGSTGDDLIDGDEGNDFLQGDEGVDSLSGGDGRDVMDGGEDNDRINGDADNDKIVGGAGKDRIKGDAGDDELKGSRDNDQINGGSGRDTLYGESGRDKLAGDSSTDKLLGGSDRDRLDGGTGRDFCNGGSSRDAKLGCEGGPNK